MLKVAALWGDPVVLYGAVPPGHQNQALQCVPSIGCVYPCVVAELHLLWACWWVGAGFSPDWLQWLACMMWVYWAWFVPWDVEGPSYCLCAHWWVLLVFSLACGLQLVSAMLAGPAKGRTWSPHSQLRGSAAETVDTLVCGLAPPLPRAGVVLEWHMLPELPSGCGGVGAVLEGWLPRWASWVGWSAGEWGDMALIDGKVGGSDRTGSQKSLDYFGCGRPGKVVPAIAFVCRTTCSTYSQISQ